MTLCLEEFTPYIGWFGGRYFQYVEDNKKKYCSMRHIVESAVKYLDEVAKIQNSKIKRLEELKNGKGKFSIDLFINSENQKGIIERIKKLDKEANDLLSKRNFFIRLLTKVKRVVGKFFLKINYEKSFHAYGKRDYENEIEDYKKMLSLENLKKMKESLKEMKKEGNLTREEKLGYEFLSAYIHQKKQQPQKNIDFEVSKKIRKKILAGKYTHFSLSGACHCNKEKVSIENFKGKNYAASTCIGTKKENQDNVLYNVNEKDFKFWGVFDGHGKDGKGVSNSVAKATKLYFFKELERNCENKERPSEDEIVASLKHVFEKMDAQLLKQQKKYSGSTACLAVIKNKKAYFSNVGDSRACIYNNNKIFQVTKDQKGMCFIMRGQKMPERINCKRAVGMKTGQFFKKSENVKNITAKARVSSLDLSKLKGPCYFILGCDGLFDYISTDQIGEVMKEMTAKNFSLEEMSNNFVCYALKTHEALKKNSDNITVLIVRF
jgi:serine/threonine protein phosphatase PrpC